MRPPRPTAASALGLLGLLALVPSACAPAEAKRPNAILVVVDTLRADHVWERARAETPRLDAFLAGSAVFERAYAHTSWTLPSHTALFSSRPPHVTGVLQNSQTVPADVPLLAEWLRDHGYATHAVHSLVSLTPLRAGGGLDRGFEAYDEDLDLGFARAQRIDEQVEPALARLAEGEEPFFLFVHYSDPHEPYHPYGAAPKPAVLTCNGEPVHEVENLSYPDWIRASFEVAPGRNEVRLESEARWTPRVVRAVPRSGGGEEDELPVSVESGAGGVLFGVIENPSDRPVTVDFTLYAYEVLSDAEQRLRYAQEIEHLDAFLGKLFDAVEREGLAEDTLVVFTADHGEGLGDHGYQSHGLTVYDELLHVPLAIRPPAGHARGAALEANTGALVRHVDVVPTMLDLLDLPALPGQTGSSLCGALPPEERVLEAEAHYLQSEDMYALFDGRHKLVFVPGLESYLLFDHSRDPGETTDVLAESGRDFTAWKERLRTMRDSAEARFDGLVEDLPPEVRSQLEAVGYTAGD